jgi:hypothetical protein
VVVVLSGVLVATNGAQAIPPDCEDGSPPPCEDPPDPDDPPPTTTTPPPKPIVWSTRVAVLDQSEVGFSRTMWGGWHTQSSPGYTTPAGHVVWSDEAQTEGTLGLTQTYLPPGHPVGFYMNELGTDGPSCRSGRRSSVPTVTTATHALLGPTITKTPEEIAAMAAAFSGRVQPDPAGAEVTITQPPTLVPQQGGLQLTVRGRIYKDVDGPFNYYGDFAYAVVLHISPSRSVDTNEVMVVSADEGILQLLGDSWKDDALEALGSNFEPDFRAAVRSRVQASVNADIAARPEVQWFAEMGYTASVRRVTTTPNGISVQPALCRVA